MKAIIFIVLACAVISAAPASAASIVYNVSGIFDDGATLSGGFEFDAGEERFKQFGNSTVKVSSIGYLANVNMIGYVIGGGEKLFTIGIADANNNFVTLTFDAEFTETRLTRPIGENLTYHSSYLLQGRSSVSLRNGTIKAAVVPESQTWMMMLAGFSIMCGMARYRRRKVSAVYA